MFSPSSRIILASFMLLSLFGRDNYRAIAEETGSLNEVFDKWLELYKSALLEREHHQSKAEASLDELKSSIGNYTMGRFGQDVDAMRVLKEFIFDTRIRYQLIQDEESVPVEELYQRAQTILSVIRDRSSANTTIEDLINVHIDGQPLYMYLARLLRQMERKGITMEPTMRAIMDKTIAHWQSLRYAKQTEQP